ncbi:MAG: Hpt domain-containing protein [Rhizobiales bacterium]|nr:Hpt domain-containing protein [Hyphomicrobiales bacterium]
MTGMPLFDPAVFSELNAELGSEDVTEILRVFLTDTLSKMSVIESGMQDRRAIKREAHSIKSSAATFGFAELSWHARELELRVEAMNSPELLEFTQMLRQVFERTSAFANTSLLNVSQEIA